MGIGDYLRFELPPEVERAGILLWDLEGLRFSEAPAEPPATEPPVAEPPAAEPEFKGMELYSWSEPPGKRWFALLPGTNRLKPEAEIKQEGHRIHGLSDLETSLRDLAASEQVVWLVRPGFEAPDAATSLEVSEVASRLEVNLILP